MATENNKSDETQISKGGELRHDGMGGKHAQFNLQSSETQPFDITRMSGKPASGSSNGSGSEGSKEK